MCCKWAVPACRGAMGSGGILWRAWPLAAIAALLSGCSDPQPSDAFLHTYSQQSSAALRDSLQARPDEATPWLNFAGGLYRDGLFNEAVKAYGEAAARDSSCVKTWYQMGRALLDVGRYDDAVKALTRAVDLEPRLGELHNVLGYALTKQAAASVVGPISFRRDIMERAVLSYQRAIERGPESALFRYNLGAALDNLGRQEEAVVCYRQALDLLRDHGVTAALSEAEVLNSLGDAMASQGDLKGALAAFRGAVAKVPGSAEYQCRLADALAKLGQFPLATEAYLAALEIDPDHQRAHYGLSQAYFRLGKSAEAERYLKAFRELESRSHDVSSLLILLRSEPQNPELRLALGAAYAAAGREHEALRQLQVARAQAPDDPAACEQLGRVYLKLGDLRHAGAFYREAVRLSPNNARALGNLGGLYVVTGQLDSALAVLLRAEALGDASAVVYFNLGVVQSRLGDPSAAENALLKATTLNPKYVRAYLQLAQVYASGGSLAAAIEVLERASSLLPEDRLLHLGLAEAYARAGRDEAARQQHQRALRDST